jgi:mannose-6-phosphate isomerase-like protein (cupin superfamily)
VQAHSAGSTTGGKEKPMTLLTLPPGAGRTFGPGLTAKLEFGQSPDFSVFLGELEPRSDGPPPHVHRIYDEAFYVLAGSVQFMSDGTSLDCPAGSFVFVPRGTPHGFANPSVAAASVLVVTTAPAIQLVERGEELLDKDGRPIDPEAFLALFASHESEILNFPPR